MKVGYDLPQFDFQGLTSNSLSIRLIKSNRNIRSFRERSKTLLVDNLSTGRSRVDRFWTHHLVVPCLKLVWERYTYVYSGGENQPYPTNDGSSVTLQKKEEKVFERRIKYLIFTRLFCKREPRIQVPHSRPVRDSYFKSKGRLVFRSFFKSYTLYFNR